MGMITTVEAANIFGINSSALRKIAARGLLSSEMQGVRLLFDEAQVRELNAGRKARRDLGNLVKETFVLNAEGTHVNTLSKNYNIPQVVLEQALEWYKVERKGYLNGAHDNPDALLSYEVKARLKIRSDSVIDSMIKNGMLVVYPTEGSYKIISLQSFVHYLGYRARQPLHTSLEALGILHSMGLDIKFKRFEHLAWTNGLGMKIQAQIKMSGNRYTKDDIYRLKKRYK